MALGKQKNKTRKEIPPFPFREQEHKIVIAHRGASGYLPEHTLEAKAMAHNQRADYLEQDVVMTKDGRLIILHDHFLDRVTNVADKFPGRQRQDGRFYAIDFTLEEIKTLDFTEAFTIQDGKKTPIYPNRFPIWESSFKIHTLEEELEFINGLNKSTGNEAGIYVEIKAPWLHRREGKDITVKVLETLKKYGYFSKDHKAFLQIFDFNELKRIKTELMPKMGMDLKLIFLIARTEWKETYEQKSDGSWENYDYGWVFEENAMDKIAQYADGIGPDYHMLVDPSSKKGGIKLTPMTRNAKQRGLLVHPYTVRADDLPLYADSVWELYNILYFHAGADGVFTDFPDLAAEFLLHSSL